MINILFQNSDYIVVDKPSGIPVHATVDKSRENVLSMLKDQLGITELYLAHRLDKDTSGCLVLGLNQNSQIHISKIFEAREITKRYVCLVEGEGFEKETLLEDFLKAKKLQGRELMSVVRSGGIKAVSICRLLKSNKNYSLLEIEIKTGRMHQIRVQLASRGHAIVGDNFYGGAEASRLYLHAQLIECAEFRVESQLPLEFMQRFEGK